MGASKVNVVNLLGNKISQIPLETLIDMAMAAGCKLSLYFKLLWDEAVS